MNATVTIISIWSKWEGLEGRLNGRDKNFEYTVEVPAADDSLEVLEAAFSLTNQDGRPNGNRCCSTTAGDIMVLNGVHYLVEGNGYHTLTEDESKAIQALTSRDTSFGYAFMVSRGLIQSFLQPSAK